QEGEIPRGWIYDVENHKIPLPAGVIGHTAAGATSQYYALIPGRFAKAPETTSFAVTGGQAVGGTVTTDDGLTVTFIAQAKQGMVIQGGGLSTNGRLKAVVEQRGQPKKEI